MLAQTRRELGREQWKLVFLKQLQLFAVDIFRKMCDDDCRTKSTSAEVRQDIVRRVFGAEKLA